jgi:hypothetical protein
MVLSNAERQKRFRERLRAKARGEALPEQVRTLMMQVLQVAAAHEGYIMDENGEPMTPEAYLESYLRAPRFLKRNGSVADQLRSLVTSLLQDDLGAPDRAIVEQAAAVLDAVHLTA